MSWKCRFFDLDGTLADTDRDIRESWKAAFADCGLACSDFDEKFVNGPPIEVVVRTLFPACACNEDFIDRLRSAFAKNYDASGFPHTKEFPQAMNLVREAKAAGEQVHIVTNKRLAGATLIAKKFGWDKIFNGIWTGDMYKDDPAVGRLGKGKLLALILRKLGIPSTDCVMYGDTINDFAAAHENGIFSIAVTWGYGREEELQKADLILK